jgi:hypothetical protein
MAPSGKPAVRADKSEVDSLPRTNPTVIGVAAWLIPGAGHFLVGQVRKGAIFFVVLSAMFLIGLAFGGRLFPFQMSEPLVFLAAASEWAMALPRIGAAILDQGHGNVVAITYEYGNTFLIVSGLLNALIVLDAIDYARGRKPA